MSRQSTLAFASALLLGGTSAAFAAPAPRLTQQAIDGAARPAASDKRSAMPEPGLVKAAVLLDRARFSPGAIDGLAGDNLHDAIKAYQQQGGLDASGLLDLATWDKLTAKSSPTLKAYVITAQDAKGPFTKTIPTDFEAQSRLTHLGYHDIREELSERFHMGEPLLRSLNPGSTFKTGDHIIVADVAHSEPAGKAARLVVDKSGHDVEAIDIDGKMLARYPASIGSTDKPAPSGDLTIHAVVRNPDYTYDPSYKFKGVKTKQPFTIQPGPNNPVGLVWMDLGGDGYGIHGTPDPAEVGKTQSHGCIRLTNWDALDLASMVGKGTAVHFGDQPGSTGVVPPIPATPAPTPIAPALSLAAPALSQAGTPMTAAPAQAGDSGRPPVTAGTNAGASASAAAIPAAPPENAKP